MRFSLRYKILLVLGLLLVTAVAAYTWLASFIFQEEKTALLFDINRSVAANTSAGVRSLLREVGDELKLFTVTSLGAEKSGVTLPASHLSERHILGAELYQKVGGDFVEGKFPPEVPKVGVEWKSLVPRLAETLDGGYAAWMVRSTEQEPRLFLTVRIDATVGKQEETFVAVAQVDTKPLWEQLQSTNLFQTFLVDTTGAVFAACDREKPIPTSSLNGHPLLSRLDRKVASSGVQSYEYQGGHWYGAFAPAGLAGLFVISQASHAEVVGALKTLLQRSLLFALIVFTLTFLASILFSKKLVENIQRLARGARSIGSGDLTTKIDITSGDEVEYLAQSFNQMTDALRASRDELERYNRELEAKVEERTAQLRETNAAIKEVQEKLLRTTQLATVGEVAGRTAHELLNPLTAILNRIERSRLAVQAVGAGAPSLQISEIAGGWEDDLKAGGFARLANNLQQRSQVRPEITLVEEDIQNLKRLATYWDDQAATVGQDLSFVQDQAQRIHRIVDRMRELSRSSHKETVLIQEAVQAAVQTMSDFLKKNGVQMDLEWNAQEDMALLNRDELVQILTNLIRNAYQAIQTRGVQGHIRVKAENAGDVLLVDVIDNGVGITASQRGRLFEQGFTTKAPSEGTGLGLAICRRYARAFGGEVELYFSEPEVRGTCFRVTIPLSKTQSAAS